ncbi:MAG: methylmalonyl-CoA mutase subunit beta [Hyphomicrobiales bacterium]|nr:methylmalonyl-CoA mutase subunit beta [Hyphomicrobiales bacterium]
MNEEILRLTEGFSDADETAWRSLVDKALRGAAFDDRLVTRSADGLDFQPLYPQTAMGSTIAGREAGRPWSIVQRIDLPDLAAANSQILDDLEGGATGLDLVFTGSTDARGAGLDIDSAEDFGTLFAGVDLHAIRLHFDPGHWSPIVLAAFAAYCDGNGIDVAKLDLSAGLDPISTFAATGHFSTSLEYSTAIAAEAVGGLAARGHRGPALLADGRVWHAGGASEVQELANVAATAIAYLRLMDEYGMAPDTAAAKIAVTLVADQNQFMTIAKFRAMRLIWTRILEACGVDARPLPLHAETAWRMMTARDVHVNMLRTTIACFAAGIGGADSITVLPFTAALGLPDGFARRVARNTQTVLLEESNLYRVSDAAAGSGYIDAATEALAKTAWEDLQAIEKEGGIAAALRSGSVQAAIAQVRDKRAAAIAKRKEPITGTSEFPNLSEGSAETLDMPVEQRRASGKRLDLVEPGSGKLFDTLVGAAADGQSITDMAASLVRPAENIVPIDALRTAEPFERLRDAADRYTDAAGARPAVFLANLGPVAAFTARATFTRNFFAAGGIAAEGTDGLDDASAVAEAFKASGARIACLCSSDTLYGEMAEDAARALKAAGAEYLYLAGRAGDAEAALRAAGVDEFIYSGCNVLETLEGTHRALGIAPAAG